MGDFVIIDENKKDMTKTNVYNQNPIKTKSLFDKIELFLFSLQSLKTKQKLLFYRLLSTMTNAGMTIVKAVSVLETQEQNPIFKKILGRFCEELKKGKNLSECLELYPTSFSESEVGIVKSGEKTGLLNKVLLDLAAQIEKVDSISGKIKGAMMYPIFIMIVVVGVVAVMMTMVVPKLLEIFDNKDALPTSTKILMGISDSFSNYWYLILLSIIGFIVLTAIWKQTPSGKYKFDYFLLKIPVFGEINQKMVLSKFSRILSGLLSSGVSVVESLNITSSAVGNEVYKQRILLLSADVQQGIKMWESLDGDSLFPAMMVQMIQVGEQTAKLDEIIVKVAEFYDEQIDNTVAVLNKLLEPFIIVTLAIIVGFIAMAIIQPIMNLSDTITAD